MEQQQNHLAAAEAVYEDSAGRDLALYQSDVIGFAEWNRRQAQHCAEYRNAQAVSA